MSTSLGSQQQNLKFITGQTVDVSRAARMLGVTGQTIRNLIELGILDAHRYTPNGWWRVSYNSLVDYINHLAEGHTPEEYLEKKRAL